MLQLINYTYGTLSLQSWTSENLLTFDIEHGSGNCIQSLVGHLPSLIHLAVFQCELTHTTLHLNVACLMDVTQCYISYIICLNCKNICNGAPLTGDLVKTSPLSFHSPGMSSSEISVSNEASSFSVTSTLASGFRISASRSNKEITLLLKTVRQ